MHQANAGHHFVGLTRETPQHGLGLGQIDRLSQRLPVEPHERVGTQYQVPWISLGNGRRLDSRIEFAQRTNPNGCIVHLGRITGDDLKLGNQRPEQFHPPG